MEMTLNEHNQRKARSYKMLLWFGMVSMFMMFAGLTSAYVVSTSRPDWLSNFKLPDAFMISTVLIIASSITFHLAKNAIKKITGILQLSCFWLRSRLVLALLRRSLTALAKL